jgi:hypothetical protein
MSFKLIMRRLVMAFLLGGHSVLGVGMSREKIESLMHAMNQSHVELSMANADDGDDSKGVSTDSDKDITPAKMESGRSGFRCGCWYENELRRLGIRLLRLVPSACTSETGQKEFRA